MAFPLALSRPLFGRAWEPGRLAAEHLAFTQGEATWLCDSEMSPSSERLQGKGP